MKPFSEGVVARLPDCHQAASTDARSSAKVLKIQVFFEIAEAPQLRHRCTLLGDSETSKTDTNLTIYYNF